MHLEKVGPEHERKLYEGVPPPENFEDLTVYLRHVRSVDAMIGTFAAEAAACDWPMEMCWYGDHVLIMPKVYGPGERPGGMWNSCCGAVAERVLRHGKTRVRTSWP